MFDQLLEVNPVSIIAKIFDSQSFVPARRPSWDAMKCALMMMPVKDETVDFHWRYMLSLIDSQ